MVARKIPMDPDAEIMTVHELAEYLRVSISTIYRLAERHELPGFKVGDWRFYRASVDAWMVQQAKVSKTAIYPPRGRLAAAATSTRGSSSCAHPIASPGPLRLPIAGRG